MSITSIVNNKPNQKVPTWRGLSALQTKPVVLNIKNVFPKKLGSIVLILDGANKGRRAIIVGDNGSGLFTVMSPEIKLMQIDGDFLSEVNTDARINLNGIDVSNESEFISHVNKNETVAALLKNPFRLQEKRSFLC